MKRTLGRSHSGSALTCPKFAFSNYDPLPALVINLADGSQVEAARQRVNAHHEVKAAARVCETARASHKAEDALINSRNWIQNAVDLKINLIAVGSYQRCLAAGP